MENRVGEKHMTNKGYEIEIIEQFGWNKYTIKFQDGTVLKNIQYTNILSGCIKNYYHPSVFNKGYLGIGKYKSRVNYKLSRVYKTWYGIMERAYCSKLKERYPTYKDVTVCKEWHNFQVFAKWFEENYIEGFELDKDILVKENKIYSPTTCCFVPHEINSLLLSCNSKRGKYPIGVNFNKFKGKFESYACENNKQKYLGTFNTIEEAFEVYKKTKENNIKKISNKWKSQITPECYRALINYKIKIND